MSFLQYGSAAGSYSNPSPPQAKRPKNPPQHISVYNLISSSSNPSLNCECCWGTTDDFTTSFLHLFFPVLHCLLGLGKLQACPLISWCCLPTSFSVCPVFVPLSLCHARWFWLDLMNGRHDHTTALCISLRWSGGLCVVWLPAGSWHRLPHR